MATRNQVEAIADACLAAHEEIKSHGMSEMQHLIRILLFQVDQELERLQSGERDVIRELRRWSGLKNE